MWGASLWKKIESADPADIADFAEKYGFCGFCGIGQYSVSSIQLAVGSRSKQGAVFSRQ
jgi:hypothetical protein